MNYRLIAAAVILALYAGLGVALLVCSAVGNWPETQWAHALTVFSAFGAMATAAASVLLGIEVQQTNVTEAQNSLKVASVELGALRETHRIALAAAGGTVAAAASTAPADQRLDAVRSILTGATPTEPTD